VNDAWLIAQSPEQSSVNGFLLEQTLHAPQETQKAIPLLTTFALMSHSGNLCVETFHFQGNPTQEN
jgi:hypothetical protein